MRYLVVVLAAVTPPAFAQEQDVQRQLMQRQQQSDAFQLQLRQSQDRLQVAPGDLRRQQEIDARQTSERQQLEAVNARQLGEIKPDTPQELRSYERQKAEDERRPLTIPVREIQQRTGDGPQPLPAAPRGIVQVIDTPR
jgi:flagellar biosynthesis GTPase FlhF